MEAAELPRGNQEAIAEDDPLRDLTDNQLSKLVEETLRANDVLESEAQMFERFFNRVESRASVSSYSSSIRDEKSINRKRSKSRSGTLDRLLRLTADQKCEIALREIEIMKKEIEKMKENSEKVLDTYKAIVEETELRLSEMKKEAYEFDRDILKGAVNHHTKKVIAEKCMRYFEDKLRAKDTLIDKLRLKNSALKIKKKKLTLQLKQKEDMGEVLHEVDFNQLKIENQQYLEKIDERNQDLLRLKLMSGNTMQVLNSYKKRLHTLTMESERLQNEITSREDLESKIRAETVIVEEERSKAEQVNKKLRKQLANFRVPEVLEYVWEKADLHELKKKVRCWERKVDIAELALKTHRKNWKMMQQQNAVDNQWRGAVET